MFSLFFQLVLLLSSASAVSDADIERGMISLDEGWKFHLGDVSGAESVDFDDREWRMVKVPHDWAIEGPFDEEYDVQETTVVEDGERKPARQTGRTGGLPHVGVGWYRTRFALPEDGPNRCFIEFDGAMSHARVFLNGRFIGEWPYGYSSFSLELTDAARFGQENVLAVRLENFPSASRWYPGAGLYRNVRLVLTRPVHVAHWGSRITTSSSGENEATVFVRTDVLNQSGESESVELTTILIDSAGRQVASVSTTQEVSANRRFLQELKVENPRLWSLNSPNLYRAVSQVLVRGKGQDQVETRFGIRTISIDRDRGVRLNGEQVRFKGVCLHHDLGPLGAAVNRAAIQRQLRLLKEMGSNAIRTSHNPPAPELLDLCDEMGFLVLDEAFDEWKSGKVPNGYSLLFDEWAEKDLRALIRRDANHPSVVMWSIGNEIREQGSPTGASVARFLVDICHDEDPTRLVTAGFNNSDAAIKNGLAEVVDIPGWNYKPNQYSEYLKAHPEWAMYGSETASTVSSRGEYYFPAVEEDDGRRDSRQISSYDLVHPPWGSIPDVEFAALDDNPAILGEFVWTGFDYLGEPTPYKVEWPSRSSYFGILDLAGIPKDRYYLYQSRWSDRRVLHLLPHWNWEGREGEMIPVHCYTNYASAELFLNGRSLGSRKKTKELSGRYRLVWEDVRYQPGELKVVAFDEAGKPVAEERVRTAGPPARIELLPDRTRIKADGQDLAFVVARIVDEKGTLCPKATNLVRFSVEGAGRVVAVGNGDATSLASFQSSERRAFNGQCLLIVGTIPGKAGQSRVVARSDNLAPTTLNLQAE